MNIELESYKFESLIGCVNVDQDGQPMLTSLCYLVSLADSPEHPISEALTSKRILGWLYEIEEQCVDHAHLKAQEKFFDRYFKGGFCPKTPVMAVKTWSPILAMLERGLEPACLNREAKILAAATGIWRPFIDNSAVETEYAKSDEDLFWAIINEVSQLALEQKKWINIIAKPGWDYNHAVDSLPDWPAEEVEKSGRILWKRTCLG